jgi:KUP system potassium uptake protein
LVKKDEKKTFWRGIVKSMGLVFGDIGTSPIYTLTVVFALTKPTPDNVLGILSLVVWTLTILVTVEYAWLAMSLDREGQGGEIMLREILLRLTKSGRIMAFSGVLTFLGVSLLMGDGVITPAITILSAVEGILLIPGMEGLRRESLIVAAIFIAFILFYYQRKGTDKVARTFGPFMLVWFICLTASGLASLSTMPELVRAINPYYAIHFLANNGLAGFLVLSDVVLCATGGEALYADMGHLGKKPIIRAWIFVFAALVINYLGQGAFILQHPEAKSLLFGMVQYEAPLFYIPFLLLTICATIIASQSIISGVFSIVYQGITTRLMPLLKVNYTSSELKSQIYIGAVNGILLFAVIMAILIFQKSEHLAAAYGLAVTGSMTITAIMMLMVFSIQKNIGKLTIVAIVVVIDMVYLFSTFSKLPHGAYWSLIIASIPLITIVTWTNGQRVLFRALRPLDFETFHTSYEQVYAKGKNISGTALFFSRSWQLIPPYAIHCMFSSNIIYEKNIFICINRTDAPFGRMVKYNRDIGTGLDVLEIEAGYLTLLNIETILREQGIQPKIIFYGVEDIVTNNPVWRVFSFIKKITPNFIQFNKLPAAKLHGVVTRIEM